MTKRHTGWCPEGCGKNVVWTTVCNQERKNIHHCNRCNLFYFKRAKNEYEKLNKKELNNNKKKLTWYLKNETIIEKKKKESNRVRTMYGTKRYLQI